MSALKWPDRPALVVGDQTWSYSRLDEQCRSIEQTLHDGGFVGRQCSAGLIYARAMFSYAAVIAIMRSNCVYVPLNPKAPAERLLKIIDDAAIKVVIVDATEELSEEVIDALRRSPTIRIISNSNLPVLPPKPNGNDPGHSATAIATRTSADPAYIIYTSGSTGEPKGVAISHESACLCMEKLQQLWATGPDDRFTQFSPLSFDYSLVELYVCWKSGGALCVPAASDALVPFNFAIAQNITVWFSVPSLANFLLKLGLLKKNALPLVRISLLGGEALPYELAHAWAAATPQSRVFNLYGPTEVTIVSTYYEFKQDIEPQTGTVPIGIPLPGLRSKVMDDGQPVETDDEPGELWLSGDQLALGYWQNPVATSAAFVRLTDRDGTIWYKTGDLVSNRAGSGLSFRGRLDRQIKLRGQRIELQEIESALREVIGCSIVAVVPVRNSGGMCEKIVAYCDELYDEEAAIKARCRSRLATYMVPDRILKLESFPVSSHGKIDYRPLAERTAVQGV
jgi:D-alanine--poly(phosphoribitol) ligase subunit 1